MKRLEKEEASYPWAPTEEELHAMIAKSEPEVAYCDGKHTEVSYPWAPTDEELRASVQKAYQEAQDGKCISHEEMKASIASWLL